MNICFLSGKIVSNMKFEFLYNNSQHISIAYCELETSVRNESKKAEINRHMIYAYDEMADYIYSHYDLNNEISILGCLEIDKIRILQVE